MHIPKKYFHDRLVLLLVSANTFLTAIISLLVIFRIQGGGSEGFVAQYHSNLGLSAFEPGSTATYATFAVFAVLVLALHTLLSMKMYYRRRGYSMAILWLGSMLLILTLIVSNALSVLQ